MKKLPCSLFTATLLVAVGCGRRQATAVNQPVAPPINPHPVAHCTTTAGLPDPVCTPGAVRTTDVNNICHGGSTKQYRPPVTYTEQLKQQGIIEYGYTDTNLADYEEDHLISLELGGDGYDPRNLWPEPHMGSFNSFQKDQVENWLHKQICSGAITPSDAQHGIATDWRQYVPAASGIKLSTKERQ